MSELAALLVVLVAAAIPWLEVLLVVPAGIVAGLPPVPTVAVAAVGNVATLVPLVLVGDRVRAWLARRRADAATVEPTATDASPGPAAPDEDGAQGRRGRARRLFDRYGLPGLAGLGPLLTGVHVAALVALAAGAPRRPTLLWLSGGVLVWAVLAAVATVLGLDALVDPDALPELFAVEPGG